jgi:uncharacterized damage-inducible protein DinB
MTLSLFYKGWDRYQQNLLATIATLNTEQLALSASSHTWTVGQIAAHIVAARVWWFHARAGEGADLARDEQWNALEHWDSAGASVQKAPELVMGLELTWQMIEATLLRWTPTDLAHVFPTRSKDDPVARSRQWIIYHVLEHDIFHGGEISGILGAHGLAAIALE